MTSPILGNITVVDMTEGVAGPYAAMLLGDMGANVIKVERPAGDWARTTGRGSISDVGGGQFIALNRNKRNIGLDLEMPQSRAVIERLVGRADVVLSNYRAGVMKRLRLGYADCRALKPDVIYCTVSGFGQEGPYAQFPASDTIMQAMSGIMSTVGEADGPPLRVGFPLIDITAANHAIQAILLAMLGRLQGRGGAEIDISLMSAAVALLGAPVCDYLAAGRLPERQGNQHTTLAPAGAYRVAGERYITIAVLRDSHWQKLCAAMNLEQLVTDERFATNPARVKNRAELDRILGPILAGNTSEYWLERLRAADILCGPINTVADVMADKDLRATLPLIDPMLPGVPHVMGAPIRYDGQYLAAERSPPVKGQHTREILAEFGFGTADIEILVRNGAVFEAKTAPGA